METETQSDKQKENRECENEKGRDGKNTGI